MSKAKASVTFFLILAFFCGIFYFVWNKYSSSTSLTTIQPIATNNTEASNLSVAQPTNPLDLGQIPLDGLEGANTKSNNNSNQSHSLDPSSFRQYEKYKSSNSSLFGDIAIGNGVEVAANKKVTIVYRMWLTDGTLVDGSKKDKDNRFIPIEFVYGSNQIIPGLQQGMSGMKAGGTRLVIVPPGLGYGDQKHDIVPVNSVLVFEITIAKVDN